MIYDTLKRTDGISTLLGTLLCISGSSLSNYPFPYPSHIGINQTKRITYHIMDNWSIETRHIKSSQFTF